MIKAHFFQGSNLRRVMIEDRKVSMMATETNWTPMQIDIDKIESLSNLDNIKNSEKVKKDMQELIYASSLLKSEKDILNDITNDFHKSGWKRAMVQEANG